MILTTIFLKEMFLQRGYHIDKPLETYLMATYEEDPFPYEWSEQDLYEQIRKLVFQYEEGVLDISVPSHQERQRMRYDDLKKVIWNFWEKLLNYEIQLVVPQSYLEKTTLYLMKTD